MKTTLQINNRLVTDVKKLAIDTGRTFTQVVEDALCQALSQHAPNQFKLHTCGGNGLQPGVELTSNAAIADLVDH